MEKINRIKTWAQGFFVDQVLYNHMPDEWKAKQDKEEKLKVRPFPTGNAICICNTPEEAKWIASRLNYAAKAEIKLHHTYWGHKLKPAEPALRGWDSIDDGFTPSSWR